MLSSSQLQEKPPAFFTSSSVMPKETPGFSSFPYVCPEPGLVNWWFLNLDMAQKWRFFITREVVQVLPQNALPKRRVMSFSLDIKTHEFTKPGSGRNMIQTQETKRRFCTPKGRQGWGLSGRRTARSLAA
jgi:hypothetical protein